MSGSLHIGTSPLTGTIFAGKLLKSGNVWASNKQDVTIEALVAVAEHAVLFQERTGYAVEIRTPDGQLEYTIKVEKHNNGEAK